MVSQTYNMIDKNWSHIKDYHFFILYSYDKIWTYDLNNEVYSLLPSYKIQVQWAT